MTIRNETQGIPIGPGTSNIIAEIILSQVDALLSKEFSIPKTLPKNRMSRFIDDYTFHCNSYDDAEKFIRRLEEELNVYKLKLNPKKTSISSFISPFSDSWAFDLSLRIPSSEVLDVYQITNYLDYAIEVATEFPEGSVLKYAAKSLLRRKLNLEAKTAALDYLLVLAMQSPALLPTLEGLLQDSVYWNGPKYFSDRLREIAVDSAKRRRSDGMTWSLYFLAKHKQRIPLAVVKAILETGDCIAILMLYVAGYPSSTVHNSELVLLPIKSRT